MPSLKIELIVDDKGNITIAKAEKGLEALNAEATKLGASFSGALGKMQTTLEGMNASLRKTEAHTAQTSKSIAGLTRSILRLYAAYYVITSGIQAVSGAMLKGIEIIDQYSNAITTMAALVTSKMQFNLGESLAEGYQRARTYAEGLVKTLEDIDKHSSMSQRELTAMAEAMTRVGVTLDYTNAEVVKGFTELSNALSAVVGNVPDRMKQINQEMKALLTGTVRPSDALAQTVASLTPHFKEQLEIHKKSGDVWVWLGGLVKGFAAAQSDIDKSWQATKSTLETVAMQVLREGFGQAYSEIIAKTKELSQWALNHRKEISDLISGGWNALKAVVSGIAATFQTAAYAVTNFKTEIVVLSSTLTGIYISGVIATAIETGKFVAIMKELVQVVEILASRALLTLASRFGLIGIAVGAAAYGVMTMIERQKELDKIVQGNDLDAINKKIDEYTKKLKSIPTSADLYAQAQNRGKNPYQEELDMLIAARDRLLAEQKRTADEMEKARKAANVQLNQNPNDEATKKAADEAKRLDDIYKKLKNTLKDSIAIQRFEVTEMESVGVQIEKNRIEYLAYVRDLDEKLSPARRIHLASLKAEEIQLKNLNALLEDHAKYVKQWADEEWQGIEDREKDAEAAKRQIEAFDALYLSLDPVIGASRRYSRALEDIKNAQNLLNTGRGGTITQEQIDRAQALLDAQRNLYNVEYVADYYSQIDGLEDTALQKRLAAIEEQRKANVLLYRDEVSANKLAAQQIGEAYQKAFAKKAAAVATMFEGYEELFGGISKLYKDGSKDAQNWQDAAKAMEIAQRAVAVVTAVAAIANQGMGDPYTAFVRIGMMAATMGALLASIGESINGGGHGGSSSESYKPTTVLGGASGEASKSIQNALELLNDVNGESYVELVGIHRNMKELNNNITGLVRNLIQSGGNMKTFANLSGLESDDLLGMNKLRSMMPLTVIGDQLGDLLRKIPYIGGLLAAPFDLIDSLLGGIASFMGSSSIAHQSSGVKMLGTTIGDILDGVIVEGLYYTSVQIKKKSFGRVSRSNRTYYQAMDDATENMFNLVYRGIAESLYDIGTLLGQDTSKILSYAFKAQQIRLSGGSDQINQTIQDWMNTLADTAAADLFGAFLIPFQKLGEGLYETAIRLVTDQAVIKSALEATGQAFRGTGEQLIYFSESLIDMAGDLDTLQGYFDTYADAFLREEEKITLIRKQLVGVLGYENLILPQTRNAYRDLVASLDLTTESGKTAYYTLMALSDAADSYYDYLEKQAENIVDTLSGYVDQLKSAKDRLLGDKDDKLNFATGMQQLRDVLNQVRGGSYNGLAGIDSALSAVTSLSMDRYGSYLDYQRDYYRALGVISELESLTSGRLTEWQAIQDTLQTNHDEDIDVAMAQLQALIGIHTAVGAQGSIGVPGYATGGSHPGGWRVVGENGPELEYTGPSSIYNNDRSRSLVDIAPLVEKLDRLIERVEAGDSVKASSLRQIERAITGITEDAFDADDRPALRVAT